MNDRELVDRAELGRTADHLRTIARELVKYEQHELVTVHSGVIEDLESLADRIESGIQMSDAWENYRDALRSQLLEPIAGIVSAISKGNTAGYIVGALGAFIGIASLIVSQVLGSETNGLIRDAMLQVDQRLVGADAVHVVALESGLLSMSRETKAALGRVESVFARPDGGLAPPERVSETWYAQGRPYPGSPYGLTDEMRNARDNDPWKDFTFADVVVTSTKQPTLLVLSSPKRIGWSVFVEDGAELLGIILGGKSDQGIVVLQGAEDVPVANLTSAVAGDMYLDCRSKDAWAKSNDSMRRALRWVTGSDLISSIQSEIYESPFQAVFVPPPATPHATSLGVVDLFPALDCQGPSCRVELFPGYMAITTIENDASNAQLRSSGVLPTLPLGDVRSIAIRSAKNGATIILDGGESPDQFEPVGSRKRVSRRVQVLVDQDINEYLIKDVDAFVHEGGVKVEQLGTLKEEVLEYTNFDNTPRQAEKDHLPFRLVRVVKPTERTLTYIPYSVLSGANSSRSISKDD